MPIIERFDNAALQHFFAGTEVSALTTSVTLAPDQGVLLKGSVLGTLATGGQAKLVNKTATDGSQVARYVLAETVDTAGEAVEVVVFKSGVFNGDVLTVAKGDTVQAHAEELRQGNIHFRFDY
ncbi:head decoration protein [Paenibacillus sp. CN-4]|uniref:head decoration protein n=1 Tax=Paenibacillus nanchangensis TaxID=3348343 RepID=UPI0039798A36